MIMKKLFVTLLVALYALTPALSAHAPYVAAPPSGQSAVRHALSWLVRVAYPSLEQGPGAPTNVVVNAPNPSGGGGGCTPNVALTASAIQTALANATANSTVCLPSGSLTVTSQISATVAANVTLMGQTSCTGAGQTVSCTDSTTLSNNTGTSMLSITIPSTGKFRMSGITLQSVTCLDHPLGFTSGSPTAYSTMRLDHNHWFNYCNFNFEADNMNGVADHNYFENPSGPAGANQVRPFGVDTDTEWTHATNFGTNTFNWFYFEDNRWERGIANDCYSSGRQVFRYNYMNNAGIQQHGTGHSGQNRGCRAMEAYGNTIIGGAANTTTAVAVYTGSAIVFDNTVNFSVGTVMQLTETRQSNYTYEQGDTPGDTGYCGTQFNGTASVWDGNTDATGYPCLDQVGRGQGDLLSSDYPTKRNNSRNCTVNFSWAQRASFCDGSNSSAWPRQALEPVYEWNNTNIGGSGHINVYRLPASAANIVENRDYYSSHNNSSCNAGAGSCTAGIGIGTLAQRPANCTQSNETGGGVGWWATDQGGNWNASNGTANDGALYKCTATNTWTLYYTPYQYPHPSAN